MWRSNTKRRIESLHHSHRDGSHHFWLQGVARSFGLAVQLNTFCERRMKKGTLAHDKKMSTALWKRNIVCNRKSARQKQNNLEDSGGTVSYAVATEAGQKAQYAFVKTVILWKVTEKKLHRAAQKGTATRDRGAHVNKLPAGTHQISVTPTPGTQWVYELASVTRRKSKYSSPRHQTL